MNVARIGLFVFLGTASVTFAQWESGSDGSDGAFSPAVSALVDLSLAASLCDCDGDTQVDDPCRWDCPSPVPGRGVYDAEQWAVVYKYTTVNVPSGVTLTFRNHPSNPPVVWLAAGNVSIAGTVNLRGEAGTYDALRPIPYYSTPGPGGFHGGQSGHAGLSGAQSGGLGPGATDSYASLYAGSAAYLTSYGCAASTGPTYGNSTLQPLIGGSGGVGKPTSNGVSGGAGGGAILIASDTQVSLSGSGSILATGGGNQPSGQLNGANGGGSGGAIRLRGETISLASGTQLLTRGAFGDGQGGNGCPAGDGGIRIEGFAVTNGASTSGVLSVTNTPSVVFVSDTPQLRVVNICGESTPPEPVAGITSTEVEIDTSSPCTISIEAEGIPIGTVITVRAMPARGTLVTVLSSPLVDAGGGLRTATATITLPGGRSEVQLRANW